MDSHYHQVMKARSEADTSKSRYYFAYSTALDRKAFDDWKEEHSYNFFNLPTGQLAFVQDLDITYDFPSRWWGGRVAGLIEKKDSKIYGLLFEIPSENWPIIQHKEGVITGMSIEVEIEVSVENGGQTQAVKATAFTTAPARQSTQGEISPRFVEALIRGAEQAGLPADYIAKLKLTR